MMDDITKQRTDLTQSFEDFERVMEDYFQIIPPDVESFNLENTTHWEYSDFRNTVTFYFSDDWYLDAFLDKILDCPKYLRTFDMDSIDGIDRQNLTITIEGKTGGLLG